MADAASHHHHLVGRVELVPCWQREHSVVELEHAESHVGRVEPVLGTREGGDVVGDLRWEGEEGVKVKVKWSNEEGM